LVLIEASRKPVEEQDAEVVARCPDVLKEVLGLVYRFERIEDLAAKAHPDTSNPKEHFVGLTTPEIGYLTPEGHEGSIRFMADCVLPDIAVPEFNLAQSRVFLQGKPAPRTDSRLPFLHLIGLRTDQVSRHNRFGQSAGGHEDLNFLQSLVTRVRDTAFPKNK
jgi:hypothetical protein